MSLTDIEKQLVIDSFAQVTPMADQTTELFYKRLFEIAPDAQELFENADMAEQGKKLMQTLGVAVGALYTLESVEPAIKALGQRHINYGITEDQYDLVEESLMWALTQVLGDAFTQEIETAWIKAYGEIADIAKSVYYE